MTTIASMVVIPIATSHTTVISVAMTLVRMAFLIGIHLGHCITIAPSAMSWGGATSRRDRIVL
jgi:hypothetical protein